MVNLNTGFQSQMHNNPGSLLPRYKWGAKREKGDAMGKVRAKFHFLNKTDCHQIRASL